MTTPQTGLFQFTYPTFADQAQWIYVHFITADEQNAFVTYPNHRFPKAAQLLDVRWFDTVDLVPMGGNSPLMYFLAVTLAELLAPIGLTIQANNGLFSHFENHDVQQLMAA